MSERKPLGVATLWDGNTESAELHIDGHVLTGPPAVVSAVFDALNRELQQLDWLRARVRTAAEGAYSLARLLDEAPR